VPLTITQTGSSPTIVWFDDGPKTATSPNGDKLYADGSGGWTAYVINGNLFLKKFTDIPASSQPTGEGEVDVYPGAGFLEFEVEGPYTMLAASGSLNWSIQWKVVKIPNTVTIAVRIRSFISVNPPCLQPLALTQTRPRNPPRQPSPRLTPAASSYLSRFRVPIDEPASQ